MHQVLPSLDNRLILMRSTGALVAGQVGRMAGRPRVVALTDENEQINVWQALHLH